MCPSACELPKHQLVSNVQHDNVITAGVNVSARCNHTLTLDEEGRSAILFGGWGLGGVQSKGVNKRNGAVLLAVLDIPNPPNDAIFIDLALTLTTLRGRGEPEHR